MTENKDEVKAAENDLPDQLMEPGERNYHSPQHNAQAFLRAVVMLERAFKVTLTHEDGRAAFIVSPFDEDNVKWLLAADVEVA